MRKTLTVMQILSFVLVAAAAGAQQTVAPATPPVPPAPPAPETPAQPPGFTINRLETAIGVDPQLGPVGVAVAFPTTQDKVWAFLELTNVDKDTSITLVWIQGSQERERMTQNVPKSSQWTTWAYKTVASMTGDWKVQVLDEAGNVVKTATFTVK